ncbi:hypothetical protein JOL62DRAFT_359535 [Phyllosticta paracitricarpa]|uniref:Uncharacterized protein n=2 Tax=Phyllosticta TaxID=121621 RepID=A0ABR1LEB4_9PEZI
MSSSSFLNAPGSTPRPRHAVPATPVTHPNTTRFHNACHRIMTIAGQEEGSQIVSEIHACIGFSAQVDSEKFYALQAEYEELYGKYSGLKKAYDEQEEELAVAREQAGLAPKPKPKDLVTPLMKAPDRFDGETESVLLNFIKFRSDIASVFQIDARFYPTDEDRAAYMIDRLEGHALNTLYSSAKSMGKDLEKLTVAEIVGILEEHFGPENSSDPHRALVLDVRRQHQQGR